jgi:hypothetical protein
MEPKVEVEMLKQDVEKPKQEIEKPKQEVILEVEKPKITKDKIEKAKRTYSNTHAKQVFFNLAALVSGYLVFFYLCISLLGYSMEPNIMLNTVFVAIICACSALIITISIWRDLYMCEMVPVSPQKFWTILAIVNVIQLLCLIFLTLSLTYYWTNDIICVFTIANTGVSAVITGFSLAIIFMVIKNNKIMDQIMESNK